MASNGDKRFDWKTVLAGLLGGVILFVSLQFVSANRSDPGIQAMRVEDNGGQTEFSGSVDEVGSYRDDNPPSRPIEDGDEDTWTYPARQPIHPEEAFRRDVALYFSSLRASQVRFNRLKSVPFGEPETITVAIAPPGVDANPTAFIGRNGVVEKHSVPLATQIEAELVSLDDDVEIRPQGPVAILLRPDREVETSWRVTARRTEPFTLQLVLTNEVAIEGRDLVDRQPFTRRFEVEVSGWRRALIWIGDLDPVWTVLGGIASLAALIAAGYQAIRFLRPAVPDPPQDPPPPL